MTKMDKKKNVKLSKGILEMKFMKKTKERFEKEADDAEGNQMYSKQITDQMRRAGHNVFVETSIFNCDTLVEGRLSFGGMNPEIEKLMNKDYGKKLADIETRKEKDLSDEQMAENYTKFGNNMSSKYNKPKKFKHKN